jgi:hypothetical protein
VEPERRRVLVEPPRPAQQSREQVRHKRVQAHNIPHKREPGGTPESNYSDNLKEFKTKVQDVDGDTDYFKRERLLVLLVDNVPHL